MAERAATYQGGKKSQKLGRHLRSPSMSRYNSTNRSAVNKAKKMAKHAKRVKADAVKVYKKPPGYTRHCRRAGLQ